MAYRSIIEEAPGNLKRSLLGTFDFTGRSTRTEVITFYIISQLFAGLLALSLYPLVGDLDFDARQELQGAATILSTVPWPALVARRAHDQDRTGWWALLLPIVIVGAALSGNGNLHIFGVPKFDTPFWQDAILIAAIIGLWAITLLPESPASNRYGPNPRLSETNFAS